MLFKLGLKSITTFFGHGVYSDRATPKINALKKLFEDKSLNDTIYDVRVEHYRQTCDETIGLVTKHITDSSTRTEILNTLNKYKTIELATSDGEIGTKRFTSNSRKQLLTMISNSLNSDNPKYIAINDSLNNMYLASHSANQANVDQHAYKQKSETITNDMVETIQSKLVSDTICSSFNTKPQDGNGENKLTREEHKLTFGDSIPNKAKNFFTKTENYHVIGKTIGSTESFWKHLTDATTQLKPMIESSALRLEVANESDPNSVKVEHDHNVMIKDVHGEFNKVLTATYKYTLKLCDDYNSAIKVTFDRVDLRDSKGKLIDNPTDNNIVEEEISSSQSNLENLNEYIVPAQDE